MLLSQVEVKKNRPPQGEGGREGLNGRDRAKLVREGEEAAEDEAGAKDWRGGGGENGI